MTLSFYTAKYVTFEDNILGGLYYLFMILIFIYIYAYDLVYSQAYLETENVIGTARLTLTGSPSEVGNTTNLPYCGNIDSGLYKRPCQLLDKHTLRVPNDNADAIQVTTHILDELQERVCAADALECTEDPWKTIQRHEYYVAGVEKYGLEIAHNIQAMEMYTEAKGPARSKFTGNMYTMSGKLDVEDPLEPYFDMFLNKTVSEEELLDKMKVLEDMTFEADGDPDYLTIDEIMTAGGISLDAPIRSTLGPRRLTGCVVYLAMEYSNYGQTNWLGFPKPGLWTWMFTEGKGPPGPILYTTTISSGHTTEEMYEPLRDVIEYDTHRRLITRTGIKIVVVRGGSLGRFSWSSIISQAASGLALITVATTIVEQIMLRAMKRRELFRSYKYQVEKEEDISPYSIFGESKNSAGNVRRSEYQTIELPKSGL